MGRTRYVKPIGYFDMPDGTPISIFFEKDRLCLDGRVVGQYVGYSRPGIAGSKIKCPTTGEDRPVNSFVQGAWQGKCYLYTISELRMIKANKKFHGRILSICGEALKSWGENTYRKTEKPVQAPLPEVEEKPPQSQFNFPPLIDLQVRVGILESKVDYLIELEERSSQDKQPNPEPAPDPTTDNFLDVIDSLAEMASKIRNLRATGSVK